MSLLNKVMGAKSKYNKQLPYTYEAKVPCWEGADKYNSYISDTICGIIEHLDKKNIQPGEARIFEVYQNQETELDIPSYTHANNTWFGHNDLCQVFCKKQYPGHVEDIDICSFSDRSRECDE